MPNPLLDRINVREAHQFPTNHRRRT